MTNTTNATQAGRAGAAAQRQVEGPRTPQAAAQAYARTGDSGAFISYLGQLPVEVRSAATTTAVLELEKSHPAALKKLATTEGAFQSTLVFIATKPYVEANVTKGITALMTARNPPAPAPTAAQTKSAGWGPPGAVSASTRKVEYSGTPHYAADAPMPEGLAQPLSSMAKRYGSEIVDGDIRTEGAWNKRTTNVICDYEVSVKNPKTGQLERVTFEGIQQARSTGWGLTKWYDTAKDVDSKVLACEGHIYGPKERKYNFSGKGPLEQWMSGAIERTGSFSYEAIPELKQRVEHFKATGETGNEAGRKRGR
jgi:hypothetical protein